LLPAAYFPQLAGETPTTSTFKLIGSSTFVTTGDVCDEDGKLVRRALSEGRELQVESGVADIGSTVEVQTNLSEESSASGVMAGAAAAAAVGAALLL
jgi:mevalonate pyrophosphate decarboxylase